MPHQLCLMNPDMFRHEGKGLYDKLYKDLF